MMLVFTLLAVGVLLDFILHFTPLWGARKVAAGVGVVVTAFASGALVLLVPNVFSVLITFINVYRVFNYIRIAEGRMQERYLRTATRRTGLVLLGIQAAVGLCWLGWQTVTPGHQLVWGVLGVAQVVVAAVLLFSTVRRLRVTAWPSGLTRNDADVPTITIAIPARNETADLQACLESIIPSDYPKLEIVVLDDCSQTRRTPEIIRSYAHDGVRFIRGEEPKESWLAKNQAYDRLTDESSGEYIVFCGVDIRFAPDSLRQLVELLQSKNKQMMSILPYRSQSVQHENALTQAMRYFWELAPPRRLLNRPPVLSSCWIIKKQALIKAGGFDAARSSIVPEAHFARSLVQTDSYSFMRASRTLGIESVKPLPDQRETAVRTRYPQLHRRPENVLAVTLSTILFLLLPFVMLLAGYWLSVGIVATALACAATMLLLATFWCMVTATRTGSLWVGLFGMPLGALYDIGLLHYSMWQYEFSTVEWKGRNVCIPAMHVIPHLPKI